MKLIELKHTVALAVLLGALLGFGVAQIDSPAKSQNKYTVAQSQTVLVESPGGSGSAVMVRRKNSSGYFRWFAWTAAHVVDDLKFGVVRIRVFIRAENRTVGESLYWGKLLAINPDADIALLAVDAAPDSFTPAVFSYAVPELGDSIYAVGNFYGNDFFGSVSAGVVAQIGIDSLRWTLVDQMTVPVYPGSSGGPVFDSSGQVLGLTVARVDATLGFFVPMRVISAWAYEKGLEWAAYGNYCPSDKALQTLFLSVPAPEVLDSQCCIP